MTTLTQLAEMLDGLGVPWANTLWRDGDEPAPPYIVIEPTTGEAASADNMAWIRWMNYDLSYYARERDYAAERAVEAALDGLGAIYAKADSITYSEDLTVTAYAVAVVEE